MRGSRWHGFGAGVADFYVVAIAIGVVPALVVAVTKRPQDAVVSFATLALVLLAVIGYHLGGSERTTFRSAGEVMLGRVVVEGRKEWRNPFGVNRALLLSVLFPVLALAGNAWDSVADDRLYSMLTPPVVLGRAALLIALLVGTVRTGAGHVKAGWLIVAYQVLHALPALRAGGSEHPLAEAARTMGWFYAGAAFVTALVLAYYHRHRRRDEVQQGVM